MEVKARDSVISAIDETTSALELKRYAPLRNLSNNLLLPISLHQDKDIINLAVSIHALGKLLKEKKHIPRKKLTSFLNEILILYDSAKYFFNKKNQSQFRENINEILESVNKFNDKNYTKVEDILNYIKVKKASELYEYGISLGQVSEILGITKWEIMKSAGQIKLPKTKAKKELEVHKRVLIDSSSLICLAFSESLKLLEKLHKNLNINFYITHSIEKELASTIKRFKYQSIKVNRLINKGILKFVDEKKFAKQSKRFSRILNKLLYIKTKPIRLFNNADASALAISAYFDAFITEERNLKILFENLKSFIASSSKATPSMTNLQTLRESASKINLTNSSYLALLAYDKNLIKNKDLLKSTLLSLKVEGCPVTRAEINEYVRRFG